MSGEKSYEPYPRPPKQRAGARSYALHALLWVSIVVGASLRLDGARSTRPIEIALIVGGSCVLVGMLVMVVISYRAGRRGWMHPRED